MNVDTSPEESLAQIHHIAITVDDIAAAVAWYRAHFPCQMLYEDATWGLLQFGNIKLAFVTQAQHPSHIAFEKAEGELAEFGPVKPHRDGTQSTYIQDPSGNSVELIYDPSTGYTARNSH